MNEFELTEAEHWLLRLASEALDRAAAAREILERDGLIVFGREGAVKPHPAVAIERDARAAFARLIQQLNLENEPKRGPGRPPRAFGWSG